MIESVEELHVALQALVSKVSGVPLASVILANQGAPAPEGLYATYNPMPIRAVGQPRRERTDVPAEDCDIPGWTDFDETIVNQMDFLLSCNFYNEGAKDAAMQVHNANFRIPILEYLFQNQIGWRECSNIRDFTNPFQAGLQPRYQIDIDMYIETKITDRVLRAAGFKVAITDEDDNPL